MATDDLGAPERAILLTLMAEARPIANPDLAQLIGTSLTGVARLKLTRLGLVSGWKENRSYVHELTDAGWAWCARELTSQWRPKGSTIGRALYAVLDGLQRHLDRSDLRLADVFGRGDVAAPDADPAPAVPPLAPGEQLAARVDVAEQVRLAYHKLAREPQEWVRLSQLRPLLRDVTRDEVDEALRRLSRARQANLVPQANRKILSTADRAAAIRIGTDDCDLISIADS